MKIGIIGLPGSGKSMLFDLLTESVEGPDYSHAPNKPRIRTVRVRDARLERLRDDYQPKKYSPATVEIHDFPGVEKEEENRAGVADLLQPAREIDSLLIVLRGFLNAALPGDDAVDPASDFKEVRGELILTDLVIAERRLEKLAEKSRKPSFSDEDRKEQALLERVKKQLEAEASISDLDLTGEEAKRLTGFCFLSEKPFVALVNIESGPPPAAMLASIRALAGSDPILVPARNELEILQLPEADRAVFMEEYGIKEFTREQVIAAAYRVAGLISFFTAGDKEVRAWTIRAGDTAPKAAGAIHSDFERGFIRAEVVSFSDYVAFGGVKGAKEKGHYRLEGKDYVVAEADVIEFRFSV